MPRGAGVDLLARLELGRRTRALLALLGVTTLIAPPLALLGGKVPAPAVVAILASSWLALFLLSERIVEALVSRAARAVERAFALPTGGDVASESLEDDLQDLELPPEEPGPGGGMGEDFDISDAALMAWGLASGLVAEVAGGKVRTYVAVHDDGLIYYVYPETYGEEVYQAADEDVDDEVTVARAGNESYLVILSEEALAKIYEMASRGEGEKIVADTPEELRLLYKIAREIARAHLRGAPQAYQDYIAYKSLVKMSLRGQLEAPQDLLDEIPDIDTATRTRIKRQIDEELHSPSSSGNPSQSH